MFYCYKRVNPQQALFSSPWVSDKLTWINSTPFRALLTGLKRLIFTDNSNLQADPRSMSTSENSCSANIVPDELIQALQDPALYDHPVNDFSVIETHISWVILTGRFAYKIKKPVNLGFVDFSTLAKRQYFCTEELRLNRRFAPDLYLEVVAIRGSRTHPRLAGNGKAIEYAVKMREFSQHNLLSTFAGEQRLESAHIDAMADVITDSHRRAEHAGTDTVYGSSDTVLKWNRENFEHIEAVLPGEVFPDGYATLKDWCLSPGKALQALINDRQANGFVRECHGDLHLGNMALIDERVTLFDCIEFNAELRWIDTMSELAFVAMDLQARGYPEFSWRFINRCLYDNEDYAGIALLRYYFVYRALVRAKVEALRVGQARPADSQSGMLYQGACRYLELAISWSGNARPAMIFMHGFSGSGKSTLARQIAESLGAIQVRSDVERKYLFGLEQHEASGSGVGQNIYTPDATSKTYQRLAELARTITQAGYTVIVDASFLELAQRDKFWLLARQCGVPAILISCDAPVSVLRERIKHRSRHEKDASEATLAVLQHQIETHDALTDGERANSLVVSSGSILAPEQLHTLKNLITSDSQP
jgi:aminoglycoside phosphotransferase family enzyme/predicted kinase